MYASQNAFILLFGAAHFTKLQKYHSMVKTNKGNMFFLFYLKQLCCLHEEQTYSLV